MALTVNPTVQINAGTGSDTAASGAGPATAVTGTAAAHTGGVSTTTITFTNSPDLSGVAQDGSAILWLLTASGRQFTRIDTVDNTAKTAVVANSFTIGSGSAVNYAIGGKRATIDNVNTRTLFGSAGAGAGWTIEIQDAQTLTSAVVCAMAGSFASADIFVVGTGSPGPVITQTANAACFRLTGSLGHHWRNLQLKNSNGTKTSADGFAMEGTTLLTIEACVLGDRANTNNLRSGLRYVSGAGSFLMIDCELCYCTSDGAFIDSSSSYGARMFGCVFHHNAGHGLNVGNTAAPFLALEDCIFAKNTGDGLFASNGVLNGSIGRCTFDGNSDGMDISAGASPSTYLLVHSCQFTNNGAYGLRGHANSDRLVSMVNYNNFFGNTTAARLNISAGADDQAVDPGYVDAANLDYRISAGTKALGWPASTRKLGANPSTGTTTYVDIGAAQRQEQGVARIIGG